MAATIPLPTHQTKGVADGRLALMLMLLASTPAAACIGPAAPHLERLASSGLPTQTLEGDAMARALAALRERIDFTRSRPASWRCSARSVARSG